MKPFYIALGIILISIFVVSCNGEKKVIAPDNSDNEDNNGKNDNQEELYSVYGYATVTLSHTPIPGVTIAITGQGTSRTTTTDDNGYYIFQDLKNGEYVETASKTGYIPYNNGEIELDIQNEDTQIGWWLTPQEPVQVKSFFYPEEDTFLADKFPDNNYGDSEYLGTGYWDRRNIENIPEEEKILCSMCALVKFDISQIPSNANIVSAILCIYVGFPIQSHTYSDVEVSLIKQCPRGDWHEMTADYRDWPSQLHFIGSETIQFDNGRGTVMINIKEAIESWVYEQYPNYGFFIKSSNSESVDDEFNFNSKEHQTGAGAYLYVEYEVPY